MLDKFLSSAIRQVGRDLGKVVSNQVFGDMHSTPIRHVNKFVSRPQTVVGTKTTDQRRKTDFEKSLNFRMSYTPKTLVNKLMAAFVEFKNEGDVLMSDGYLSANEAGYFFGLLQNFSEKAANVAEALEINPKTSDSEMEYISKISEILKIHVREIAAAGFHGSEDEINEIRYQLSKIEETTSGFWDFTSAGLLVASLITCYFVREIWMIFPVIITGVMFWNTYNSSRDKNERKESLEKRLRREISIKNILNDMLLSDTYKISENS